MSILALLGLKTINLRTLHYFIISGRFFPIRQMSTKARLKYFEQYLQKIDYVL